MRRRRILQAGLSAGVIAPIMAFGSKALAAQALPAAVPARVFDVTTTVDLRADGPAQVWLPLFQSAGVYQRLLGATWETQGLVRIDRDAASGARVLHASWSSDSAPRQLKLAQRVATWDRAPSDASAAVPQAERDFWTRPSAGIPTGGIVRETVRSIVGDLRRPRDKARAIYDWVVANTFRDAAVGGCGAGNVEAMLRTGQMGGKCVDINRLFVALARSAGLPARDIYGLRLADSRRFKSLGRAGLVTGAQHCRAEVWLDDAGWLAVDPADVRKAVLEEKLPVDSAPIRQLQEELFGGWEGNWAGYNSATDIRLADAPAKSEFDFLMYPMASVNGVMPSCLDAANFAYRIESAEVTA